ncbi:MAG: STAS domain-containing protein [Oligoflexia bacterium]|nr:STAS domain-containing protein [Oligoflexia bacterium]MBF0366812.1 STAS domain-containing protein [Oligoflexia bacterium]
MSLTANINTDVNGNIIIQLKGLLDYEINSSFKREILSLLFSYPSSLVTLDFCGVDFVGSSGINMFVDNINAVNSQFTSRVRLINVKSEFIKIFRLYGLKNLESIIEISEHHRHRSLDSMTE